MAATKFCATNSTVTGENVRLCLRMVQGLVALLKHVTCKIVNINDIIHYKALSTPGVVSPCKNVYFLYF